MRTKPNNKTTAEDKLEWLKFLGAIITLIAAIISLLVVLKTGKSTKPEEDKTKSKDVVEKLTDSQKTTDKKDTGNLEKSPSGTVTMNLKDNDRRSSTSKNEKDTTKVK